MDDLYEYVDKKQLTTEFGGSIHYRHQEWIEQRQVREKINSTNTIILLRKFDLFFFNLILSLSKN